MRHARTQISDEVSRRLLIHMSRPPLQAMPYHGMPCYPLTRKLLVYLGHGFVALFAPLPKSPQTPRGDELSQPAHAMATSVNPKGTERGGGAEVIAERTAEGTLQRWSIHGRSATSFVSVSLAPSGLQRGKAADTTDNYSIGNRERPGLLGVRYVSEQQ